MAKIEKKGQVSTEVLNGYLETHLINIEDTKSDDINQYFIKRAKAILDAIETATGKAIAGRDEDVVVRGFCGPLV